MSRHIVDIDITPIKLGFLTVLAFALYSSNNYNAGFQRENKPLYYTMIFFDTLTDSALYNCIASGVFMLIFMATKRLMSFFTFMFSLALLSYFILWFVLWPAGLFVPYPPHNSTNLTQVLQVPPSQTMKRNDGIITLSVIAVFNILIPALFVLMNPSLLKMVVKLLES